MEFEIFIKKLLNFYNRFTDEFSIAIELRSYEKYKKEYSLIKKDFEKVNFEKESLSKDVNLMLVKINSIFEGDMNIELIEEYLEDQNKYNEESDFDSLSFGDMVSSGIYSQINEYLFDSSGVRIEEESNPEDELNEPSRHEK